MASEPSARVPKEPLRESPLGRLGHGIAHHPWYSLVLWTAIVLVCLLPASSVGSVITGSFDNPLPSSDASVRAQNEYVSQFPNAQSAPSSAIVLLESPNIVGPDGKNATMAVAASIAQDRTLRNVSSVDSLYSVYSSYLAGEVQLGWAFLGPALAGSPSLPASVNQTASALWGPVSLYVQNWAALSANLTPGTPASSVDWPAFNETRSELSGNPLGSSVLVAFYNGSGGSTTGFNASVFGGCLTTHSVTTCAEEALRSSVGAALPTLFPSAALLVAGTVLDGLNLTDWTLPAPQQNVSVTVLGTEVGLAPSWLLTIWNAFPATTPPTTAEIGAWVALQVASDPIPSLPLPTPPQIYRAFVNPAGTATLIVVSFGVPDTYTVNGSSVTYADVSSITTATSAVLAGSPEYAGVTPYVTGGAALTGATNYLATSALSLLLVLTIVVLLVIMLLYFRAPAAPLLAFGMIGVALVASFAAIFVIGVAGVLLRRNVLVMFMSIELMLNAVNLAFVALARRLGSMDGQVIVFFVMTVAAAEAAVGLGIIISMFRNRETVNADELNLLRW